MPSTSANLRSLSSVLASSHSCLSSPAKTPCVPSPCVVEYAGFLGHSKGKGESVMMVDSLLMDEHRRRTFQSQKETLTALALVKFLIRNEDLVGRMRIRDRPVPQLPFSAVVVWDTTEDQIALLREEGYLLIADHSMQCLRLADGCSYRNMENGTSIWFRPL